MLEKLYTNIGEKIKKLARILLIAEIILGVILAIVFMCLGGAYIAIGLSYLILIPALSAISSMGLYATGHMICKLDEIAENTAAGKSRESSSAE